MISVEEAKAIIVQSIFELSTKMEVQLIDALGYKLAEDIYAPLDLPPFNQSNVDGYAIRFSSNEDHIWNVIAEIKAGDHSTLELKEGEAARIFTGAMVPARSDCILMQEKITREGDSIQTTEALKKGEHIREKGAQLKKAELAVAKGTIMNPAVLGFLSGLGLSRILVYQKPRIYIIITGNELQTAGSVLESGKVYESNSIALQTALFAMGLKATIAFVKDDKKSLEAVVAQSLKDTDLLLISGGISVGDYDFVEAVLNKSGTTTLFYKVAQKPGKPLFFGKNNNSFIFGLPGNPASALTCFYEFVYPALRMIQGRDTIFLNSLQLPALKEIPKKKGLANYLKAEIKPNGILPLSGQESFIMKSFAGAGAFIYLPMEKETVAVGELVEVHLLPNV